MTSDKQIEANRLNAQESTGPTTPEGKAAVRFNSLRHGLRARTAVLPGEDQAEFDQLCANIIEEFQPGSHSQLLICEQMAVAQWKLKRLGSAEFELTHDKKAPLDRYSQYQTRLERSYWQAYKELERLKTLRERKDSKPKEEEQEYWPVINQLIWENEETGEKIVAADIPPYKPMPKKKKYRR